MNLTTIVLIVSIHSEQKVNLNGIYAKTITFITNKIFKYYQDQ